MKAKRTDRPSTPAEPKPSPPTTSTPSPPVDLEESVAGEEDPGASLDVVIGPGVPDEKDTRR